MGEEQPYNALFRKEVNANLNPENYHWDLKSRINRVPSSRSRMLTYNGQTQTRSQWAKQHGMSPAQLHSRLATGKTMEQALQPPKTRRSVRSHLPSDQPISRPPARTTPPPHSLIKRVRYLSHWSATASIPQRFIADARIAWRSRSFTLFVASQNSAKSRQREPFTSCSIASFKTSRLGEIAGVPHATASICSFGLHLILNGPLSALLAYI